MEDPRSRKQRIKRRAEEIERELLRLLNELNEIDEDDEGDQRPNLVILRSA